MFWSILLGIMIMIMLSVQASSWPALNPLKDPPCGTLETLNPKPLPGLVAVLGDRG